MVAISVVLALIAISVAVFSASNFVIGEEEINEGGGRRALFYRLRARSG